MQKLIDGKCLAKLEKAPDTETGFRMKAVRRKKQRARRESAASDGATRN
jgi:hypothetical protein